MRFRTVLLFPLNAWRKTAILSVCILIFAFLVHTLIFAALGNNPLEGKRIILDPGHGGVDGGTNDGAGFLEKDINLQIGHKLEKLLLIQKAGVAMTRETDTALDHLNQSSSSRHERDLRARVDHFNSGNFDVFVSIHVNRSSSSQTAGPLVLYYRNSIQARHLAECLQNRLNELSTRTFDRKIAYKPVKSDFFVLRESNIPGVIVEAGFISNPAEKQLLQQEDHQRRLAEAIILGLNDYFKDPGEGQGKNDELDSPGCTHPKEEEDNPFTPINEVRLVYEALH